MYRRSFGKIDKQNGVLGFQMVNPNSREFFIYADPLITIFNYLGDFVRVKKRDREPKYGRGYYQGEIYGIANESDLTIQRSHDIRLTLYFGPAEKTLKLNKKETSFLNAIEKQEFFFPYDEFKYFVKAIEAMYTQHSDYMYLKMNAEVYIRKDAMIV